ncbi:MAG: hypothetical protein IJW70_12285 [Clostridia bacterium]|nr:hypothetical protein [Clostridia bacterium]MBQ7380444.1 hypothetical protein [Clostridia bacterium]
MKRILCLFLSVLMTVAVVSTVFLVPAAAEEVSEEPAAATPVHNYISTGLYAWYSGEQNTEAGLDTSAKTWQDLIGDNDLPVGVNADNYFTEEGLHVKTAKHFFPNDIVSVVNGEAFTVEIEFGDFKSIGGSFNTFMNSSNDNFALFRRNSENVIEWKFGGGQIRPKVPNALDNLPNHLITVTYEYGESVVIYVDGVEKARSECPLYMGANDLFIGHSEASKDFEAVYKNIRFYTRALSAGEVLHNAAVDGYADISSTYVQEGLVSLYSGVSNTESGYDPAANIWTDLVGENDLTVKVNDNNYFTEQGLRVTGQDTTVHYFPQPIVDLVNGQSFTVEILFSDFLSVGSAYNTFMNSTNDNFALYRNVNTNQLIFKFAANPGNERPVVEDALYVLDNALITVTYNVGGKCRIYCNGELAAEVACPKTMGANDLFIAQRDPSKTFDTTYRSIRFYDRELSASEVYLNAQADGVTAVMGEMADNPGYVSVAQPVTNIVGDVAMIRPVDSKAELESMMSAEKLPASAMVEINPNLNVLANDGSVICTFSELLTALEFKVLPCVVISNKEEADALADYLHSIRFYDVQLISADKELLKYAREKMPNCYGILDMRADFAGVGDLTEEQLLNVRRAVKTNNASVAVLPVELCRNEDVQYLYDRQVNVWAWASDAPSVSEQYFALLSGAVGVVSDATDALLDVACNKLQKNTMTRMPINIGHRGIPSKSPENCIEGAMYAYELGAQVIEIDVYLTKDNQAVLMHDGTTGRTCNQNISVEGSTLAELTALYCNKGYENNERFKDAKVPSLDAFLAAFKDTDVRFYIEIKSGSPKLVPIVKELVEKYDMYDQCSVISFSSSVLAEFRKVYPEMSVGALCQAYMNGENPESDFRAAMNFIGKNNATLNPRFSANGSASNYDYQQDDLRAAMIRGIQIHPWTFAGGVNAYAKHFIWGYAGLTGDNADAIARATHSVVMSELPAVLEGNVSVEIGHTVTTYGRNSKNTNEVTVEILAGEASVSNNVITPTAQGDLTLITYSVHTIGKNSYRMYTQPATFTVEMPEVTTAPETEQVTEPGTGEPAQSESEGPTEQESQPAKEGGCKSFAAATVLVLIPIAAAVTRKKKD